MAARHWCFTNYDLLDPVEFKDNIMEYLVYQLEECPQTARRHHQGYFCFKKKRTLNWIKNNVHAAIHLQKCNGSPESNRNYCTKLDTRVEGTEPVEFGVFPRGPGARNDLAEFQQAVKDGATESHTRDKYPVIWARYPAWARSEHDRRRCERLERFTPEPEDVEQWAIDLEGELDGPVNRRKVIWYYDEVGGRGKSNFARRYQSKTNTPGLDRTGGYIVNGGKYADVYYAYKGQRVVFFDWSRDHQEAFPYSVVENFKNGYFLSTKYESREFRFRPPHVVVFANWLPDQSKLSADRWDIRHI